MTSARTSYDLKIWQPCIQHDTLHNLTFSVQYLQTIGFILFTIKRQPPPPFHKWSINRNFCLIHGWIWCMVRKSAIPWAVLPQIYGSRLTSPWGNCHRFTALTLTTEQEDTVPLNVYPSIWNKKQYPAMGSYTDQWSDQGKKSVL
jgi:hypothetical protein